MQHNRVHNGSIDKTSSSGESLGVLAMGAINEIMSKNCVPHDFEDFLLQMFRNTFQLLQRLVRDQPNSTSCLQLLDSRLVIHSTKAKNQERQKCAYRDRKELTEEHSYPTLTCSSETMTWTWI